jgi:hypothetical protein
MQNNQEAVQYLTEFIASDRAEQHYHALCQNCATTIQTDESRQLVADAKRVAAGIVVQLSDPSAPADLWATLVAGTIFDSMGAMNLSRTPAKPATDAEITANINRVLAEMMSGTSSAGPRSGWAGNPPAKDGWGRSNHQSRVEYIRARAIKGSNVNPFGDIPIPPHASGCPNRPVEG